ncbi:6-phosphofructokinase [Halanaerocella petrolearia]
MEKIGVLTSGGDAPGMNGAIRAIVKTGIYHDLEVIGIEYGYIGLLEKRYRKLKISDVENIIHRGGTILKSGRTEDIKNKSGFEKAVNNVNQLGLDGLIVIGGNGSLKGAEKFAKAGIKTIGIPATIDNDVADTDYSIGFDTACSIVINAVDNILDTATSLVADNPRVFLIEVMGRDCGEIAMMSSLASSIDLALVPEEFITYIEMVNKLKEKFKRGKNYSIILMSEGAGDIDDVSNELEKRLGFEVKPVLLGHQQRGGKPTAFDRVLASKLGVKAVEQLIRGEINNLVGVKNNEFNAIDLSIVNSNNREWNSDFFELSERLSY